MARIPRGIVGDIPYHILNRANGRQTIFKKDKDYAAFVKILLEAKRKYPVDIFTLCLMGNHWHFSLSAKEGKDISNFMRWITHTHTQRYHAHYKTTGYGHVYQGRYKSFPIEKDNHFLQVCRYIERNPVRAKIVEKAEDWKWSSAWIREKGTKEQKKLFSPWPVEVPDGYQEWLNTPDPEEEEKLEKIRTSIQRGRPYGSDSWIKDTVEKLGLASTLRPRGGQKKVNGGT
ncbi:MAG: REP-associated tyrosine transposase [Patescibacteria group bacterium]|nr:REP-associated tyrosine transposase [Patescibacteria group bacterium]